MSCNYSSMSQPNGGLFEPPLRLGHGWSGGLMGIWLHAWIITSHIKLGKWLLIHAISQLKHVSKRGRCCVSFQIYQLLSGGITWSIYTYSLGLLRWHQGNRVGIRAGLKYVFVFVSKNANICIFICIWKPTRWNICICIWLVYLGVFDKYFSNTLYIFARWCNRNCIIHPSFLNAQLLN